MIPASISKIAQSIISFVAISKSLHHGTHPPPPPSTLNHLRPLNRNHSKILNLIYLINRDLVRMRLLQLLHRRPRHLSGRTRNLHPRLRLLCQLPARRPDGWVRRGRRFELPGSCLREGTVCIEGLCGGRGEDAGGGAEDGGFDFFQGGVRGVEDEFVFWHFGVCGWRLVKGLALGLGDAGGTCSRGAGQGVQNRYLVLAVVAYFLFKTLFNYPRLGNKWYVVSWLSNVNKHQDLLY